MRIVITGSNGFIARNLRLVLEAKGHTVVEPDMWFKTTTGEACVHANAEYVWMKALKQCDIDVVVHNAAVVGTDVVAMDPSRAVMSNVQGTYNIVRAANAAGARVCYIGTTVIYDTPKYQDTWITEDSVKKPLTYYGIQKLSAEQIVTSMAKDWTIVRPLFAFGGLGDMNSLVAKTIYAQLFDKGKVDMFLDPLKVKDYLHVSDFCKAVDLVCQKGWGQDWNVSAETPMPAGDVVNRIDAVLPGAAERLTWHPSTDYLGNHRLSSRKIRENLGWKPELDLFEGIRETLAWIGQSKDYNPLKYLEEAKLTRSDLVGHFPTV